MHAFKNLTISLIIVFMYGSACYGIYYFIFEQASIFNKISIHPISLKIFIFTIVAIVLLSLYLKACGQILKYLDSIGLDKRKKY